MSIRYDQFLTTVVHFIIIAFSIFIVVKVKNRIIHAREN
ncbi:MAG: MscL family protein [Candidatus Marinimicrobia bacterium]|nr:MscL family protein [Candidatus Neomarinimicrobiota bacterium]